MDREHNGRIGWCGRRSGQDRAGVESDQTGNRVAEGEDWIAGEDRTAGEERGLEQKRKEKAERDTKQFWKI